MANESLGRAVLVLTTDQGEFRVGLDQARVEMGRFKKDTQDAGGVIGEIGPLIKGAFAVGAIVSAGKAAIDYAGNIADISSKLRISTDTAQEWEATFGKAGVELTQVAKAATELSVKVIGGDKSAVAALQKLGFTVEQLKAMKPEERFTKVADALAKVQDSGEQLYASKAIFGKAGPDLLAALDGNLEGTIANLHQMGVIIDSETIAAADEFGDQVGIMGKQLMALLASVLTPLLPVLTAVGNTLIWVGQNVIGPVLNVAVRGSITLLGRFWEMVTTVVGKLAEMGSRLPGVGAQFAELATWLKDSGAKASAYVNSLWVETEKAGTVAEVARPKLRGFGEDVDGVGTKGKRAAERMQSLTARLEEVTTRGIKPTTIATDHLTEALPHENPVIADLDRRLRLWTTQGLEPLEKTLPGVTTQLYDWAAAHEAASAAMAGQMGMLTTMPGRIRTTGELIRQETTGMGSGFLNTLGGWVTNIPKAFGNLQQSLTGKLTSLFGASTNSVLGGVISTGMNFVFGPLGGIATQLMQKGLQKLGEVAWAGLKKIGGFFKNMFGGPDAAELAGRQVVEAMERGLTASLTASQKAEAGGDAWKETVIALRDKYLELGLTEQDALADAEKLWKSSKGGAEEAARVVDEIKRRLQGGITVPVTIDLPGGGPDLSLPIEPMARGGVGRVLGPTLFLAGERGPEDYAFGGAGARGGLFAGAGAGGGTAVIEIGGRVLAEVMVPEMAGAVRRYGLIR